MNERRLTGFWEAKGPDVDEVRTTLGPVPLTDLLNRLRDRLERLPAGTWVRVDLITWDEVWLETGEDA